MRPFLFSRAEIVNNDCTFIRSIDNLYIKLVLLRMKQAKSVSHPQSDFAWQPWRKTLVTPSSLFKQC